MKDMDQLLRELTQLTDRTWGGKMKRTPENREYALEILHDAFKQARETGLLEEISKEISRVKVFEFVKAVTDRMDEKIHRDQKQPELQKVVLKV